MTSSGIEFNKVYKCLLLCAFLWSSQTDKILCSYVYVCVHDHFIYLHIYTYIQYTHLKAYRNMTYQKKILLSMWWQYGYTPTPISLIYFLIYYWYDKIVICKFKIYQKSVKEDNEKKLKYQLGNFKNCYFSFLEFKVSSWYNFNLCNFKLCRRKK